MIDSCECVAESTRRLSAAASTNRPLDTQRGIFSKTTPRNADLARRHAATRGRIADVEKLEEQLKEACDVAHQHNRSKIDYDHIFAPPKPSSAYHTENEDSWLKIPPSSLAQIEGIFYLTDDRPRLACILRTALEAIEAEDKALEVKRRKVFCFTYQACY